MSANRTFDYICAIENIMILMAFCPMLKSLINCALLSFGQRKLDTDRIIDKFIVHWRFQSKEVS